MGNLLSLNPKIHRLRADAKVYGGIADRERKFFFDRGQSHRGYVKRAVFGEVLWIHCYLYAVRCGLAKSPVYDTPQGRKRFAALHETSGADVGSRLIACRIADSVRARLGAAMRVRIASSGVPERGGSGPDLEMAVQGFETFEGIHQLQAGFARRVAWSHELFCVPDRELDAIDGDASLVGHLELDRRGPALRSASIVSRNRFKISLLMVPVSFVREIGGLCKTGLRFWAGSTECPENVVVTHGAMVPQLSDELLRRRSADTDGWGYTSSQMAIEPTVFALLALSNADAGDLVTEGIRNLRRLQLADGQWPTILGASKGSPWATALAANALMCLESPDEAVERALASLVRIEPQEAFWLWRLKFRIQDKHVRFSPSKFGWSWVPGTMSWVIPTSLSLIVLEGARKRRLIGGSHLDRRLRLGTTCSSIACARAVAGTPGTAWSTAFL